MMRQKIVKVLNGVPSFVTKSDIHVSHPTMSFRWPLPEGGIVLEGVEYHPYDFGAPPEPQEGYELRLKPLPEFENGRWVHNFEMIPIVATRQSVKAERDRRLAADFEFQGKMFQRDGKSLDRITGAATLAGFAIAQGAQPGNLRWAKPDRDFGWIASDDTIVPMDAQTAFAFGQAAAARETSIIFAAKQLREMEPIPTDFADDKWWP